MALGDDPKTVALHYSAWAPERQERLTRMFKKAYSEKPKLLGISGNYPFDKTSHAAPRR
jgi:hypothetical protein